MAWAKGFFRGLHLKRCTFGVFAVAHGRGMALSGVKLAVCTVQFAPSEIPQVVTLFLYDDSPCNRTI